ncbi:MAG: hypothetical protein HKL99_10750 [Burkholderiales bacterium]|nr:hypothetical protein [Burkholderiales bacterium]
MTQSSILPRRTRRAGATIALLGIAAAAHAQTTAQPNIAASCGQQAQQVAQALSAQAQNAQTALNNVVKNPTPAANQACLQTDFANFNMGQGFSLGGLFNQVVQQITSQACSAMSSAINNTVNTTVMAFNGQVQQITALPANLGGQVANGVSGGISSIGGAATSAVQQPVMQATGASTQAAGSTSSFFGDYASKIGNLFK